MIVRFVLRAAERGFSRLLSTSANASYVAGRPDRVITRHAGEDQVRLPTRSSPFQRRASKRIAASPIALITVIPRKASWP